MKNTKHKSTGSAATPLARITLFTNTILCLGLLLLTAAVSSAETTRQYQLQPQEKGFSLVLKTVTLPELGKGQVLVKVHAVSLNRRDVFMLQGSYPAGNLNGRVPISDGAGEVIATGPGVSRFNKGDRVVGIFFTRWIDGKASADILGSARGGQVDGMLSEKVVADEDSLVSIPAHLSYEEAATLPCAGVTAWNGLFKTGNLQAGQYVLLEGTGGVSMLGLKLAVAAGAKPIITSSSDAKLKRAKALGAVATVNYRTHPDWEKDVLAATNGAGVDQVLEVGGKETLPKALASLGFGGHIAIIGLLSGFPTNVPAGMLMQRGASVSGIYVGSRADFEAMNAFISAHKVKPVVDKVVKFEDAPKAFKLMENNAFFGKIVIRM